MEKNTLKVSFGNRKLPKNTMVFNLPTVITCPSRTAFCEVNCYALKAEKQYTCPIRNVLNARKRNFKISQTESFVDNMRELILKNLHKIEQFRIHESGDFYNQKYLHKWYEIARSFPTITFYAYTKSFYLNFTGKPSNFVLIASFDESTREVMRLTYESKKQYFANTFTIVDKNAKASCIQDCSTCNLCWKSEGLNLTVNKH